MTSAPTAPDRVPLPDSVRIGVQIYIICEETGSKGHITQRLNRLPDFKVMTDEALAEFIVKAAPHHTIGFKKPRLMTGEEVKQFLGERE